MEPLTCPNCGQQTSDVAAACDKCGHDLKNGALPAGGILAAKDTVPAEVTGWVIEKTPPDLLAWARQTFNEEEHLAAVREIEETGGLRFEDFIGEIEEIVKRRD